MKSKCKLTGTDLKYLAIFAMTIDHAAYAFVDKETMLYFFMRLIGRLTAPMMSFFLVEGFCHTKHFGKYLTRMLLFGVAAQPFYFRLVMGRPHESVEEVFLHGNALFTLSISLVMLKIVSSKERKIIVKLFTVLLCFMLADLCDWAYIIPAWVLGFYCFRDNRLKRNWTFVLISVGLVTYRFLPYYDSFAEFCFSYGTLLSLIPLHFYNGERGKNRKMWMKDFNRWLFYVYYPLHLAAIVWLQGTL